MRSLLFGSISWPVLYLIIDLIFWYIAAVFLYAESKHSGILYPFRQFFEELPCYLLINSRAARTKLINRMMGEGDGYLNNSTVWYSHRDIRSQDLHEEVFSRIFMEQWAFWVFHLGAFFLAPVLIPSIVFLLLLGVGLVAWDQLRYSSIWEITVPVRSLARITVRA